MFERAADIYPFAIAVFLPPAGFLLGIVGLADDRALSIRIMVVSALAAAVWALLIL